MTLPAAVLPLVLLACSVQAIRQDGLVAGVDRKCCRCGSGIVIWSNSGSCSTCKGDVQETRQPSAGCTNEDFPGGKAAAKKCANECPAVREMPAVMPEQEPELVPEPEPEMPEQELEVAPELEPQAAPELEPEMPEEEP